jgi:hypothetical protein
VQNVVKTVKEKKTTRFPFLQCRLQATWSRVFLGKKGRTCASYCYQWISRLLDGDELPATGWRVAPHCSQEPEPLRRQAQGQWLAATGKTTSLPVSSQSAACSRCSFAPRRRSGGSISLLRTRAPRRSHWPLREPACSRVFDRESILRNFVRFSMISTDLSKKISTNLLKISIVVYFSLKF